MKQILYTEEFFSVQGESLHTGRLCSWLRLFSCNLQCRGFGQEEPSKPESWIDPYDGIIAKEEYTNLEQVPTPDRGCDSAYSWSAKFKHLVKRDDPNDIADRLKSMIVYDKHSGVPKSGHIFTGGEPLLQQSGIVQILKRWRETLDPYNYPMFIGFETNGTHSPSEELLAEIRWIQSYTTCDVYFSISPKLEHVSGELPKKAINLEAIKDLLDVGDNSYLKFVLNEDENAWTQAQGIVSELEAEWPLDVWVMPVGGLPEQQLDPAVGRIADKAISKGWNVSPRVHLMLWGSDQIGR